MAAKAHTGQPTLEEVAALAGVGRGTVSRVINNSPRVKETTRRQVQAAIDQLGYVPNRAARALAGRRNDAVALVIPEAQQRFFAEPFFSGVVHGVGDGLADTDTQLLLTFLRNEAERERFLQYARGRRVDGVLLVSLHGSEPLPDQLAAFGMPTVLGGRRSPAESVPHVDVDNVLGARSAVRHLWESGRRAIATVTGPPDMFAARSRVQGYREELTETTGAAPDDGWSESGDFTEEGGRRATERLLARHPRLDAVFAASDLMAVGALGALRAAGRRVPDDVAVVGFDDSSVARHTDPQLTSVRQPLEEMGRAMARLLLDLVENPDVSPAQVMLPTELVVRGSA